MTNYGLSKNMKKQKAEVKRLYLEGKILEGDILEQKDYAFNSSRLVLLVIGPNSLAQKQLENVYTISQHDFSDTIYLDTEFFPSELFNFEHSVTLFSQGQKKYEHYKKMLQNAGIWEDDPDKWKLREKLIEETKSKDLEKSRLAFRKELKKVMVKK